MSIELSGIWDRIRSRGFLIYFISTFSIMFLALFLIDLLLDRLIFEEVFSIENFLWWDLPTNMVLSVLFSFYSWKYGNKRLKMKSDVIEMNLNKNYGKKEK